MILQGPPLHQSSLSRTFSVAETKLRVWRAKEPKRCVVITVALAMCCSIDVALALAGVAGPTFRYPTPRLPADCVS